MKYVILRSDVETKPRTRGMPRAGTSSVSPPASPKVEVDEMKPQAAVNVSQKKSVMAIAPVIPMKLITPVATGAAAAPAADGVAWGVRAVGADTSPFNGEGIVVAVLDTGIDPAHPAFKGVKLTRKNFTSASADDDNGHGTHCAGTIFGRDVDGTRIGIARGVKKALIGKVLGKGGGGSDKIVQAIQWAVNNGANVISMSLGIDFPGYVKELEDDGVPTDIATSMALEGYRSNIMLFERLASFIAAQNAFLQAALLVAAAGNESRMDENPEFEIAVAPPAVADGFVSVAALAQGPQGFLLAPFSNVGARVSGPGVDIQSAKPGGGLTSMSGTSMATPHVAGVAALWAQKLSKAGELTGKLLADRLVGTAATARIKTGFAPHHVGAGMVQAPQN
ncbi:MAG TPA: S8 family serine peptidase [Blastocatellia bacterium]|nr:S8 family serine peptidase [Blastocatellia bacterium]